ncbi:hypothetical protein [Streptomyces sp. NBC_01669]|uniref:hypothetical protein n=1 Tax=Streptomyces sp. NBC_01669 TaxID=2975909 RepID=UPI0022570BD8|nr:hypothetical protein [Streptomyces sp. NBC_01669]MCX4538559.1 hypothetical protein [Streptomyces sp. NBC_01669]
MGGLGRARLGVGQAAGKSQVFAELLTVGGEFAAHPSQGVQGEVGGRPGWVWMRPERVTT